MTGSEALFEQARELMPGGVNSPVRAFNSVGGTPPFIKRAGGARVWDEDGGEYIDFVSSWGPMILGHAHPEVVRTIREQAGEGTSYGAPTRLEVELARLVCQMVPGVEMLRLVSSGTEATMSALRLARAATGRDKVIKFSGCYHGHADSFLVQAGSGLATLGMPSSPGVSSELAGLTLVAEFNDIDSVRAQFENNSDEIAAVIVEPVAGNMGVITPEDGFLENLKSLTGSHGALLMFDEVITGFRLGPGGAQELYGVTPDLTTLGKILGGGLPIGAFGGRRDLMEQMSPTGPVYQAGTLSGNPLAVAAGLTSLKLLKDGSIHNQLSRLAHRLREGVERNMKDSDLDLTFNSIGSMGTLFFHPGPVTGWGTAAKVNTELYGRYFHAMLQRGIYLAPSQFEASFLSAAHTEDDIDQFLQAQKESLTAIA